MSYRPFGPVTGYTLGGGQVVTRTYDANGVVTDVNSAHFNAHYQRDAAGQIVGFGTSPTGGNVETYAYDPLHRLTAVQSASFNESYTYSKTGDRLSKTSSDPVAGAQGPYTYQPGTHRLVDVNGGPWTFDANGSVTQRHVPGTTIGYVYDGRGRLAEQDDSGYAQATFAYNAMNQRVSLYRSNSGQVSRFVYDEAGQLLGNYGFLPREYIWMDGLPVGALDPQQGAVYVIADGLGTPRRVDVGDGSSRYWQWLPTGNPFGEQSFTGNYVFNLRFPGQFFDAETGLLYNVHRYYHPDTGRYLQSDPVGINGGMNSFAYGRSNPLLYVDPLGLRYAESWAAGGAVVGGTVTAGGSVVVDALTSGVNILATPTEIAVGSAVGGGIGYVLGSALDWATNNTQQSSGLPPGYWPADTGAAEWGRRNGLGAREGKGRFHGIKQDCPGSKATDVFGVDPKTGDVIDPLGEVVGNLDDVKSK